MENIKEQTINIDTYNLMKKLHLPIRQKPKQSLLQKILRELYHYEIIIIPNVLGYTYQIFRRYPNQLFIDNNLYQKYEEALEPALQETIKSILL